MLYLWLTTLTLISQYNTIVCTVQWVQYGLKRSRYCDIFLVLYYPNCLKCVQVCIAAQKGYLVPNIFWSRYFFYFWPLYSNKKSLILIFETNTWVDVFQNVLFSYFIASCGVQQTRYACTFLLTIRSLFPISEFVLKKIL